MRLTLILIAVLLPSAAFALEAALPNEVYAARRARLIKRLGGCAAAIKAHGTKDAMGKETVDPYFFYLTGIDDPDTVLLLAPKDPIFKQTLLFTPRDPELEIWTGYRDKMSARLRKKYDVDYVGRIRGSRPRGLSRALRRSKCWAYLRPAFVEKPGVPADVLSKYLAAFDARTEQRWQVLEHLRAVKDDAELQRMQKAIEITAAGHRAAVRSLKEGIVERQVQAEIKKAFFDAGGTGLAFASIVGSGPNGAILHWMNNDRVLKKDDLVVVDIGASYGGYAADITRTWPVSGKFEGEQKKVYEIVLAVQQEVIDAVKPGISLDRLHRIADHALLAAGYEFPHYIGHFVGLEVHDVGDSSAPLEAGMVITVEPGIYLKDRFGVRIEDMVLVTRKGHRLMTSDLPRSVKDVEAWMAKARE